MKFIFYALLMALAPAASADTFILKDGVRLEGEVTGEMDGAVLVKTKYGSLTINKNDIAEQKPAATVPAPAQPANMPLMAAPDQAASAALANHLYRLLRWLPLALALVTLTLLRVEHQLWGVALAMTQ